MNNICGTEAVAAGTPAGTQITGDCKVFECNGSGSLEAHEDNTDLPDDTNECTDDTCLAGEPTFTPVAEGSTCLSGAGSMCDAAGNCVQCLVADDCPGQDTECQTRSCDTGVCGFANAMQGAPVASQTDGDCMKNQCDGSGGVEAVPDDLDVVNDNNDCTANTCSNGEPQVANEPVNTPCGMSLHCNGAGTCVGCTSPADCGTGGNACLDPVCNAGVCGTTPKANGTSCSDGNLCTQTDTCQAGACTGANPVVCTAQDQCHDVGTCAPATGMCSNPNKANGTSCIDGDLCTQTDTCQAGACTGANPVVCTAQDQCHDVGTCAPATGLCSNPNKANGTSCIDGDLCTQTDTCQAGACTGANPVVCTAQDQCHDVGTCAPATGLCSNPNKANGTTCSDGNLCTQTDTCQAGACTGANPVVCTALDQCHDVGTCAPATGVCSNPNKADNTACSDGNLCTQTDTCQAGACTGANPVVCTALNECHDVGTCAPATGACSNPTKMDGTACTGGTCTGGTCILTGCSDGTKNGTETDIDCGGGNGCPTCANGLVCGVDGDCTSGHCVGNVCVQCAVANDCPGTDTECQARTCDAGTHTCGFSFTTAGFAVASQTAGDCKENQCDGAGNIVPANKDTDLPVDNNQCTGDVCTSGVASNPNLPVNTACSQNGGTACDGLGACVVRPAVTGTTPAAAAANVYYGTTIAVTFSKAMTTASITGQTAIGACTGSVQLSSDDFTTCLSFASATPTMTGGGAVATFTPAPALSFGRTYRIKVLGTVADSAGVTMGTDFTLATGFTTALDTGSGTSVIISQVYGGGGNSGAPYTHDFIELHNRGTTAVDIGGWSVQFINAAGSGVWGVHAIPASTSLGAGKYFLIQETSNAPVGSPLPSPDLAGGTLPMGATSGKVALVTNSTAISGACPSGAQIIDMVGYGATATCFETAPTAAPSNTTSIIRKNGGCEDNNNNAQDFAVLPPTPRSTASAAALTCAIAKNETGSAAELDFCNVQFPNSLNVQSGTSSPVVYAQAYEAGVTDLAGPAASLFAQIGHGPKTVNPENQSGWVWTNATFNVNVGNNDEWQASFTAPAVGSYFYTSRFSFDGVNWTYCDLNGAGSSANLLFDIGQLPTLTVTP